MEQQTIVPKKLKLQIMVGILCFALALIFPLIFQDYIIHVGIITLLYALLAVSWNIIGGYGGMMSFGQAAFYGIGAYTSTILLLNWQLSPWIGMLIGGIFSAILGLIMGYLCFHFKLRGWYFGLVTMAFGDLFLVMATNFFPGQAAGLYLPLSEREWYHFQFAKKIPYYYIILSFLLVSLLIAYLIERSRIGYYLRAIREDEDVAESLGVYLMKYRLIAFSISGFFTAIGGTFFAQYLLFIDPNMVFSMDKTIEIVIRALVGGMGTLWGPVLGSLFLTPLGEIFNVFLGEQKGLHLVFYGIILVVFIMYVPHGLLSLARRSVRVERLDEREK